MWLFLIVAVAVLILISGLVTMVEAAIFSVPMSKVHLAVDQKRHGARRLLQIKEHLQRPVAAMVILNNGINILGSIFYGSILCIFLVAFFFLFVGGTAVFVAALISQALVSRVKEHPQHA